MKPHITLITLGVDDLERAVRFYRDGLQLPTDGIVGTEHEHGAVAFFELTGGLRLGLFARENLARDAGIEVTPPSPCAADTFWGGYAGCFLDPDRHLWEVAWNPAWTVD